MSFLILFRDIMLIVIILYMGGPVWAEWIEQKVS
jgi:hypothetical protein